MGDWGILRAWPFEPLTWALLFVTGWWYVRASSRIPRVRRLSFTSGLAVLGLALGSPLATYAHELFSVHMIQHLGITLVAAPLLVLGQPVTVALRSLGPSNRRYLARLLRSPVISFLTHPAVTWLAFAAAMWFTHFSPLYEGALDNSALHVLEHALYITVGILFWLPLMGADPLPHRLPWPGRIAYLVAALPQQSFLGLAIYSANDVLYDHYGSLDDQRVAALIMWLGGDVLLLGALVWLLASWMRYEQAQTAEFGLEPPTVS